VKWVHPLLVALWVLLVLLIFVVLVNLLKERIGQRVFYLVGAWLAGAAIFDGFFAILTGVCPVPTKPGYLYAYDDRARFIGLMQIFLALGVVATAIFLVFVATPV